MLRTAIFARSDWIIHIGDALIFMARYWLFFMCQTSFFLVLMVLVKIPSHMKNSGRLLDNQTWHINGWPQQKLPKFGFRTHTTALCPVEQSSILSAKYDCPVVCQKFLTFYQLRMIVKLLFYLSQKPFDFRSVMMYGPRLFGINNTQTLRPKLPGMLRHMGKSRGLSEQDILQTNLMYKCPGVINGEKWWRKT